MTYKSLRELAENVEGVSPDRSLFEKLDKVYLPLNTYGEKGGGC